MFSSQKFQKPVIREFVGRFEINFPSAFLKLWKLPEKNEGHLSQT